MPQYYTPWMKQAGQTIGRAFETQGVKRQQAYQNKLAGDAYMGDPRAMQELMQVNPEMGAKIQQQAQQRKEKQQQLSLEKRTQAVKEIDSLNENIAKFDTFEEARQYAEPLVRDMVQRYPKIMEAMGEDAMFDEDDYQQAKSIYGKEAGRGRFTGIKAFAPITLVNPKTKEKKLVSPTVDPLDGKAKLSAYDVPEGFEISRETPEEKRAADVVAKGKGKTVEITAKGAATRQQDLIGSGLTAADSMANINRGIELLDSIKTGGINVVSLKAKQLFGVEGADEAELSSRLGKAVLSQLRETFGAAFTEREGARLATIEAGFGKSTEGNKRLLEQTKRIIERAAKRGIRAAERAGDLDSAEEIRESLGFSLTPGKEPAKQTKPTSDSDYEARKEKLRAAGIIP